MNTRKDQTEEIKQKAMELGFDDCGIAKVRPLHEESDKIRRWLKKGYHGNLKYLEKHIEKRIDPARLVPGAKSVISVILNYYPAKVRQKKPVISKYAYGEDYHTVIRHRLKELYNHISKNITDIQGRIFVDSAPLLEKAWAAQAGLGWIGKNSLLISPKYGSFVFIGDIVCDLELNYDQPIPEQCGNCTKCIDACPTGAIVSPREIDVNRCISYLTVEYRSHLPEKFRPGFGEHIFGCDICQDVCPYNKRTIQTRVSQFEPSDEFLSMDEKDYRNLDEEHFSRIFERSPIRRLTYKYFMRNIRFII